MREQSARPSLWLSRADKIQDENLRAEVIQAATRNWAKMVAYAEKRLYGTVDPADILDSIVDSVVAAGHAKRVRNFDSYFLASFLRKVGRLFRRERRVDYRSPEELAALREVLESDWVRRLDAKLQIDELEGLMDERTRTIFAMGCQGFSTKEIGNALGMSEDSVRRAYSRGIERLRRRVLGPDVE
jgi:RNA polymerase sigma factor (sigma-70 family)